MNTLTLIVIAALLLWWYKPLRVFIIERTNRTVKVLLVVFPLLFVARLAYNIYRGEQDDFTTATLTAIVLLLLWIGLVWLGNELERRRPTKRQGPDLKTLQSLSRIPGAPKIPSALTDPRVQQAARAAATNPEVRRAAQVAVEAAAKVDWGDVAGSVGRHSGRLAARLKKSMANGDTKRK